MSQQLCRPLLLLTLLQSLLLLTPAASVGIDFTQHRCEPIAIEACQNIGYNATTKTQNLAGQADQREAELMLTSFAPLIQYKCSANLRFFLCSVLTPMCDSKWPKPIGPCRPLCQHVHRRCYPVLKEFGFEWPSFLNCSRFPLNNARGDDMCMAGSPEVDAEAEGPIDASPNRPGSGGGGGAGGSGGVGGGGKNRDGAGSRQLTDLAEFRRELEKWQHAMRTQSFGPDCGHMRNREQYVYINQTADCLLRCGAHDLFSEDDKRLADVWAAVLATLCALSSLLTIATFLIDRSRFKYPVRPVLFMALCYLCYSLSYFVRLAAGREAASCDRDQLTGSSVLIRHGLDNTNCAVVFLLQYFFSTAASTWYVMLVFTWLLQAGWKWSPEAVARKSCYFHLPAWVVPVCLTVCVLIVRKVEADELFGMCNVGNQNSYTLLSFVIVPNVVFLALEIVFLLAGFVAMARVRRHVKSDGQKTNKFDVLMGKIGLFSALYVVPNACITAFNVYDYTSRDLWHVPGSPYRPSVAIFLIKVFASLVIGVTTILWIWSAKTLQAWRRFLAPWSAAAQQRRSERTPSSVGQYPKLQYQAAGQVDSMQQRPMQHQHQLSAIHHQQQQQQQQHQPTPMQHQQQQQQQAPLMMQHVQQMSMQHQNSIGGRQQQQQQQQQPQPPSSLASSSSPGWVGGVGKQPMVTAHYANENKVKTFPKQQQRDLPESTFL